MGYIYSQSIRHAFLSLSLSASAFLCVSHANARPISYTDSWTVMQFNNSDQSKLLVHYSPSIRNSFGVAAKQFHSVDADQAKHAVQFQWNHLLVRKNTRISQANLYSKVQAGYAFNQQEDAIGSLEIAGDWETRRWFTSYEAKLDYAHKQRDSVFSQSARVGVAPYVAEYNNLHTWLMLQVNHKPEATDKVVFTPLVRFFKGDYLAEIGISDDGDALFNWIVRY